MVIAALVRASLMGAVLYASQVALAFLPNIELVTLLIVIFTRLFGREATAACTVYVFLTAITNGFGIWWFVYLAVWPLYSLLVYRLRSVDSYVFWAILNGAFGLVFGAFFALPYVFISPSYALSYWIAGIPWDITHCIGNFFIALVLGKPLELALRRAAKAVGRMDSRIITKNKSIKEDDDEDF